MPGTILDRFIHQLNMLVPFVDMGHEEIFEVLEEHYDEWNQFRQTERSIDTFELFQQQINQSAHLLGYSYFEVFLGDLAKEIYKCFPNRLPKEKTLSFDELLEISDYPALLETMIAKEIGHVFYKSMEKIIKYFEKPLNLKWPEDKKQESIEWALIRNCVIHNSAIVDSRLSNKFPKWKEGTKIILSTGDIHRSGLHVRSVAVSLYEQAERIFSSLSKQERAGNGE